MIRRSRKLRSNVQEISRQCEQHDMRRTSFRPVRLISLTNGVERHHRGVLRFKAHRLLSQHACCFGATRTLVVRCRALIAAFTLKSFVEAAQARQRRTAQQYWLGCKEGRSWPVLPVGPAYRPSQPQRLAEAEDGGMRERRSLPGKPEFDNGAACVDFQAVRGFL